MKKIFFAILIIVIVIIALFANKFFDYRLIKNAIKKNNYEYEYYLEKEILGTELTTVINKAVDNNEKNKIKKDNQGFYIQDDENSVEVEIKMIDLEKDTIYKMETFYSNGMIAFVQYYNSILFKCTKIEYNSKGKVKYLLFEQVSN